MASLPHSHTLIKLLLIFIAILISFISVDSVTTVSISESLNRTLICALTISTPLKKQNLNCTSFVGGVRTPITINNNSISAFSFSETVSGDGFLCGLINSRSLFPTSILACWRFSAANNGTDLIATYHRVYKGPELRELDSGNSHICAIISATNRLQCWQWNWFRDNAAAIPSLASGNFSKISVGEEFVCGISRSAANKTLTCVGSNIQMVGREPSGAYAEIAAGPSHACAISAADGSLSCWGDIGNFPRDMRFVSLASGENRSCGLRGDDNRVVCWGQNGLFALPESLRETEFVSLEGKRKVFCGVEYSNSSLYCWGFEDSNSNISSALIFDTVLPGPCRAGLDCPCGLLAGSGKYCPNGFSICQPCIVLGSQPPPPPPPPIPEKLPQLPPPKRGWSRNMLALLIVGCIGSFGFVSVFGFFLFRYCKGRVCRVHDSGRLEEAGPVPSNPVLSKRLSHMFSNVGGGEGGAGGGGAPLEEFDLETLLEATENFSESRKIGAGSFGSVYRGTLPDGREVAVKRAETTVAATGAHTVTGATTTKRQGSDKDRAFVRELEFLSRLHHKNLVRLLGFYEDTDERVLVYEYLPNGTLHNHLHRRSTSAAPLPPEEALLTWPARIKVALDAARGVQYLHDFAVPPIIHRDIKSANILLDSNWTAKVSDFGLSLMGPEDEASHLSLRAAGTVGYIDPEYFRLQKLTTKSDVYSFGVVLLEILSGHKAIHRAEGGVPRNVVDYAVPYILRDEIHRALDRNIPPPTPYEIEAVAYVGYLAADCVAPEGRDRPVMAEVVGGLERALAACLARPELSRSTTESST